MMSERDRCVGFIACVFAVLVGCLANADEAHYNPALFAEVSGIDDESTRRPLELFRFGLDVEIEGSIAVLQLTASFRGDPNEELEGHFSLGLPEGAAITGYALDVEETMIDGVLVENQRALHIYEGTVREGVDPGYASISTANVFSTKVYPINQESGRTIRVTMVAPIISGEGLVLPLSTRNAVESIEIAVRARGLSAEPRVELPSRLRLMTRAAQSGYAARAAARNVPLTGALTIAPTSPQQAVLVSTHPSGQRFFQIHDRHQGRLLTYQKPERVRIYWDRSRSRRDALIEREIELLERYLRGNAAVPVDLVLFASDAARVLSNVSHDRIGEILRGLAYRGATSFDVLADLKLEEADRCLLFSDGLATAHTIGHPPLLSGKPVGVQKLMAGGLRGRAVHVPALPFGYSSIPYRSSLLFVTAFSAKSDKRADLSGT